MNILFWQWHAFMQNGMENALKKLNIEYRIFNYQLSDWEHDTAFVEKLEKELEQGAFDAVISVNYCPLVSAVCQNHHLRYIAWVYDSPVHIRDLSSLHNSCNKIYFFDRGQVEKYKKQGYGTVFHLPLAADETVWEFQDYLQPSGCDVAFVGQLYKSDYNYLMAPLPQYYRGMMDGMLAAQGQVYGAYLLDEMITKPLMEKLNEFYQKASQNAKRVMKAELEYACACEVTGRERFTALSLLAGRYNVHLYSGDRNNQIEGIKSNGYVDYYTQMPSVFKNAKINLNISLKTIRTGIPLRVFDVLSCGGFLITNYQEELTEYFEPGVDLVVYEDVRDLVLKTDYYLKHEEERRAIAQNGHRKVRELCTFEGRMRQMLEL